MSFYVYETQHKPVKYARTCDKCGKGMNEGYLHDTCDDTYCTSDCLFDAIGLGIASELLESGVVFWTTWYDEVEAMA